MIIFLLGRLLFLLFHYELSFSYSISVWLGMFFNGLKLDLSAMGYIMLFPFIVVAVASPLKNHVSACILRVYAFSAVFIIVAFSAVDIVLYHHWGVRLDASAFRFLGNPREVMASMPILSVLLFASIITFVSISIFIFINKYVIKLLLATEKSYWKGALAVIILSPFCLLGIRGGTGTAPVNLSTVYFHSEAFPNHAAINVLWKTGHSFIERTDIINPFVYHEDDIAVEYIDKLYNAKGKVQEQLLLNSSNPDIILIVIESFSAKLIESLGGAPDVTPCFNNMIHEGVFFNNFYANDSRTDKSLVSIFSAYPALGTISVIKFPDKTNRIGHLSRELNDAGYSTAFYYGGEIDFANIRSYLVNGKFSSIVAIDDFDRSERVSRWGVPDHIVFDRFFNDCEIDEGPYFNVLLTLSNHEPFDIPVNPKFGDDELDNRIYSAAHYTDSCLGDFIVKAKESELWDNSLIIITADHGTRQPGNTLVYHPDKYHIPMLWTGGAVVKDTVISSYMSQSDMAKTLLHQLGYDSQMFPFSRNILNEGYNFSFFEFNNGFGMISDSGFYVYDNEISKIVLSEGEISDYFIDAGKAIQQKVYDYYLEL